MEIKFSSKIDDLGRILFPKELRQRLGWNRGDIVSITHAEETANTLAVCLLVKQSEISCFYCKKPCCNVTIRGKEICDDCLDRALHSLEE